jgi:hypothetical protein
MSKVAIVKAGLSIDSVYLDFLVTDEEEGLLESVLKRLGGEKVEDGNSDYKIVRISTLI